MSGRPQRPLKLYGVFPRGGLCAYLQRVGWRGPVAEISTLLDELCPRARVADELYVDLTLHDFDAPLGSRIGIVFAPQHLVRARETAPDRAPLLDDLVARSLCTPAQRAELRRWPRRYRSRGPGSGGRAVAVERWLDVKLVWESARPVTAKAYLGLAMRPALPFDGPWQAPCRWRDPEPAGPM
jgi:hypothetical protein